MVTFFAAVARSKSKSLHFASLFDEYTSKKAMLLRDGKYWPKQEVFVGAPFKGLLCVSGLQVKALAKRWICYGLAHNVQLDLSDRRPMAFPGLTFLPETLSGF